MPAIVSIVEDELDIKNLFYDALSKTVYGVLLLSFSDSVLALEHFRYNKGKYRLVIADWKLPNLNGLELLNTVKQLNPNVSSILISAYEVQNEPRFQRYVEEGIIDRFIQKPTTLNYLCREVNNQIQD
jgi:two-component system probable response regulator PhcQ